MRVKYNENEKGDLYAVNPDWNNIDMQSHILKCNIENAIAAGEMEKPTTIIGVSRGGLVPALILSHALEIPLVPVRYSSNDGKGQGKYDDSDFSTQFIKEARLLVVDDIADSGKTLAELRQHYNYLEHVHTAALYYKDGAVEQPDFSCIEIPKDAPFIYFPWEVAPNEL